MVRRILVVEDDPEIAEIASLHLRGAGFATEHARDGRTALDAVRAGGIDLLVLDLSLGPGLDGIDVCRTLREESAYLPVLILSARTSELDRVLGLELGADDYLTKPFSVRELVARVKAVFRRLDAARARLGDSPPPPIRVGALRIDEARREVAVGDHRAAMTPKEFDLLIEFARNPGRVYTRAQLLDRVWGYQNRNYEHTVNSHISRLRAKIEEDPSRPRYLRTVWGVGYRFCDPEETP